MGRQPPRDILRNVAPRKGSKHPLLSTRPDLVADLVNPEDATEHTLGARAKLKWRCAKGHMWTASVSNRNRGTGCPYCSHRIVLVGETDLATTHPELASELADQKLANSLTSGSGTKVAWKCVKGHGWEATVIHRTKKGTGCPYCMHFTVLAGETDLATTHPDLAAELIDQTRAATLMAGSNTKVAWLCVVGHTWEALVSNRALHGTGCPYCSGRKAIMGETDLATTHPALALELADVTLANKLTAGGHAMVDWHCTKGHTWNARVSSRGLDGQGCPYCSRMRVLVGETDLATTHPELAAQLADPALATTVTSGSSVRADWCCTKGHTWRTRIVQRTEKKSECPYCSRSRVLAGETDLATTHPDIARELVDQTLARTLMSGAITRVEWQCVRGHMWTTSPRHRTANQTGCPYCSGRKAILGETDLATLRPDLAAELVPSELANVLTVGSSKKVEWRCQQGHTWHARVSSRTRIKNTNCPACANYGFDPTKPAWVYLVAHTKRDLIKIGISNDPETRLAGHHRNKWQSLDMMGPWLSGQDAYDLEQAIITGLRNRGAVFANDDVDAKYFDGYTESWARLSFPATHITDLQDLVRADEPVCPGPRTHHKKPLEETPIPRRRAPGPVVRGARRHDMRKV
jgi:DNA-directed RNA polymerase subunit RPC12/RpoP